MKRVNNLKRSILTIAALGTFLFLQSCCCDDSVEPTGIISCEAAMMKGEQYSTQYPGETTDVTFDMEEIEEFICQIKSKADEIPHSDLSFRVYFARDTIAGSLENTVFLAGSYTDVNGAVQNIKYYLNMGDIGNNGIFDINCAP